MNPSLFDTNVLLDIATSDPQWQPWSAAQFSRAAAIGGVAINPIIYAELAPAFANETALNQWLDATIFTFLPLPYTAGWCAAQAFIRFRRAGGLRPRPLPDFYICAHAEVKGLTLVTRDPGRYRTYFPKVTLITP